MACDCELVCTTDIPNILINNEVWPANSTPPHVHLDSRWSGVSIQILYLNTENSLTILINGWLILISTNCTQKLQGVGLAKWRLVDVNCVKNCNAAVMVSLVFCGVPVYQTTWWNTQKILIHSPQEPELSCDFYLKNTICNNKIYSEHICIVNIQVWF